MNTRYRKMLSVLLAILMLVSLIPATVLATADTAENSADDSVANGKYTDGTWVVSGNGTETYTVDGTEVKLSKTAAPVAGMENTYDVTLKVETSTNISMQTNSGAVVLVIDVSGSMGFCAECGGESHSRTCMYYDEWSWSNPVTNEQTRMTAAKNAAKEFLASYAGTDENASRQLAIVTFSTGYRTVFNWANVAGGNGKNSYDAAVRTIDTLRADGGTNLEGGLYQALGELGKNAVSGISAKHVILQTDGAPTYRIGGGNGSDGSERNNTAAENQARAIKNAGATLHTVCFGDADELTYRGGPTIGNFLKNSIATSADTAYNADNTAGLINAFKAITESITGGLSGEGWTVTDPMADKINVAGTVPDSFTTEDGKTYTWKLDEAETRTEGSVTTYVYTCTYRVTLDVQAPGFVEGQLYPTNEETWLNIDGEQYAFPVPGVKGVLPRTTVSVSKVWSDADNQDGIRPASVTVQLKKNGVALGEAVTLSAANQWTYTWTELIEKSEGITHVYTVEEVNVPSDYTPVYSGENNQLVVTNSHETEKMELTVEKRWVDQDNQDGIRPEKITVNLLADGVKVNSAELTAADAWTYTFTGLDKNKAGKPIVYTVEEVPVEGYTATTDGYVIINTHEVEKISVPVSKVWDDDHDRDGKRPSEVTVKLLAGGEDTGKTITLSSGNNWAGSFTDLDKLSNGTEIVYSVAEVKVDGYTTQITGTQKDGFVITNSHTPETISVSGSKTWDDNDNQDGARPSSIVVNLLKNGNVVASKAVAAADDWKWTFTGLYKSEAGEQITYSVTETAVEGYTTSYNGYDITNTHAPEKTSVTVSKAWEDHNNQDGIRANDVTVKLLADGEDTGKTLILSSGNNWTGSFADLDRFSNGVEIAYTVAELKVDGYTTQITGTQKDGFVITNSHTPEIISIAGSKTWDDNNNQDGARPESITINLLKNGQIVESKLVTAENGWAWSFTGLDKYENGVEINYSITENAVDGYSAAYDGYNVTNTHTPEKTSLTVSKAWEDKNDQDGIRPAAITVKLLANGQETGLTLTLSDSNKWTASFEKLDKYEAGEVISYTVEEVQVEGYATVVSGSQENGYVITNSHTPEVMTVSGSKTWNDSNNQDGVRPESIRIDLLKNGKVVDTKTVTAADDWAWTFAGLDKYENGGEEIQYTITEAAVEGYSTAYDGYNVVNSYTPEEISITVTKAWADSNNAEGIRPSQVTVKLYADGVDTGRTLVLNSDGKWSGIFTGLPKYAEGKAVSYTISEVAVKGYNSVIKGSMENGFVITNSHTTIPQTGDNRMPMLWLMLMLTSGLAIVCTGFFSRKRRGSVK